MVTIPVGSWDLQKANKDEERIAQFRMYNLQIYERIIAEIQRADGERSGPVPITQYTVIYDWQGFSYRPILNVSCKATLLPWHMTIDYI